MVARGNPQPQQALVTALTIMNTRKTFPLFVSMSSPEDIYINLLYYIPVHPLSEKLKKPGKQRSHE